jgi:hypothetical protein
MFLAFAVSEYNYIIRDRHVYPTYNYTIIIEHNITKLKEIVINHLNDGWKLVGGATITAPMYSAFSQTMFKKN